MEKGRLEAFSDGVLAIIITIMVLELTIPHHADLSAIWTMWPKFLSYVVSFLYVGIYWNNHHHMFQASKSVDGSVLWANLHLLFWLSLLPFTTGWMGENHFDRWPALFYGVDLLGCAIAYYILQSRLVRLEGRDSILARAIGRDLKGKLSPLIYISGIAFAAFDLSWVALFLFGAGALLWLIPDPRIETVLEKE